MSLPQLLRVIDEVYSCKSILEDHDHRGGGGGGSGSTSMAMHSPTKAALGVGAESDSHSILEDFFFDHMEMTYGEEWVALHVVHGIFLAIEKHRVQVGRKGRWQHTRLALAAHTRCAAATRTRQRRDPSRHQTGELFGRLVGGREPVEVDRLRALERSWRA